MSAGRRAGPPQARPSQPPEAAGVPAVQVRAGGLGAAAVTPLAGSADVPVGRGAPFIVGIDLGTTNTVVAFARVDEPATIELFELEQLVAPGEVAARPMLPSQRYHPAPGEMPAGDLQLPWPSKDVAGLDQAVIGSLARQLGAQVPGRLVVSAKSWLSHAGVDRLAAILPWGAADDVPKVSPVAASASYLAHVRAAWDFRFPGDPLESQQVVLTVPASFDDGARALTLQAAREAGLPALHLLEEPQAAFYDWLFRHRETLADELAQTKLVLVCDVGGGTTDLSLIKVRLDAANGKPELTRVGVGNHLMLGGDNMDLALAHVVERRLAGNQPTKLSAGRLSQLVERCRAAKEQLLAANAPDRTTVTLLGAGSKLIGGTRSVELARAEVEQIVVDGFFARVAATEQPQRARAGLVEFGLPYASDPVITRHLAGFLQQHAAAVRDAIGPGETALVPDTLLLNGGVFRADALSRRLLETLGDWRGRPLHPLHNDNPDLAVARGAVAYGLARHGGAPRIGGGSARSYFLVLDGDAQARGVCLLPQGSEEGREIRLDERTFALRVGQPVRFHLASSTADAGERPRPGSLISLNDGDFIRLPPIATVVAAQGTRRDIAVNIVTSLTEVGTLELHCVSVDDPGQRWQLEFQLRGDGETSDATATQPGMAEAIEAIDRIFGARSKAVTTKDVKHLRAQLEHGLGARERWAPPLLRALFDALWQRARGRRRSAEHERLWLNLSGYCLRPGFGHPLDDWRVEQLWSIFEQGVQHPKDAQVCAEWWTLWRRVVGGLNEAAQLRLLEDFAQNTEANEKKGAAPPASVVKGGVDDMLRLGASLERIPVAHKIEIGEWLTSKMDGTTSNVDSRVLWAIGRLGARQPFHGGAQGAVPADVATRWLETLLALDWKRSEGAAFAAAHLARMTGDRSRDLPDAMRERVIRRLTAHHAAPSWIAMVREATLLDEASTRHVFGEALPPGLKLIG